MVHHVRKTILAGILAAFVLVPAATADARTFERTFPSASRLCDRVADGHAPRSLRGKETLVGTECADLHAAFDAAEAALNAKLADLGIQEATARASANETCRTGTRAACRQARAAQAATLADVFVQRFQARLADRQALQDARDGFWSAIDAIRSGEVPPPDDDPPPVIIS